jgi:ATP phosphoribosyltransferase
MKQKDIVLIIVVVFVSGVLSFFVSRLVFAAPKSRQQAVEVVDPITTNFPTPSNKYFNNTSIDPTQLIQIGGTPNLAPFKGQ